MQLMENDITEFKREYTEEIRKTVIAFANTNGGKIYIGIEDDGTVVGVEQSDRIMLQASNSIRDAIKPDVTMFISYHHEQIDDKNVVVIEVQKGTACPYYLESKGLRPSGVYVRQGASSVPATDSAIRKMILDTDGERYEMRRCLQQELTFDYADKEFARANVDFGEPQKKSLRLLTENGIYTNLGQLISDQCVHTIKIAAFDGAEKANFKDRTEITGSLLKQAADAYSYLDRWNHTKSVFPGIHRVDVRDYPIDALREALLNAIIHRDYAFGGSILISIFDDRMEFISIGGLVTGISYNDMMLGVSIQRNEGLANIFYRLELIESYGTGIPKIMRCYQDSSRKPIVTVTDNAFKIVLPNMNYSDAPECETESREEIVLKYVTEHGSITRKDVEALLGVSQASAARLVRRLTEEKRLAAVGNGKALQYRLAKTE